MNILFLLRGSGIGGLEVVTSVLANKFVAEGHHVSVFIFRKEKGESIADRLDKRVTVCQRNDYRASKENVSILRDILVEHKINVIINQWGFPLIPIKVAKKAKKGLRIKIISVYHNDPSMNGRIQGMRVKLALAQNMLKLVIYRIMLYAFNQIASKAMRYNYKNSDCFLVLSKSYIRHFQEFTHLNVTPKLHVMENPVTIETDGFKYENCKKQKEIIFVGRLDNVQKKVNRVLSSWNLLEAKYPEWRLTIVGDGVERQNLEKQVNELNLKHIDFAGFQNPLPYYKRASILVMTSDFEGFPLVLAEAMSFCVVPVVYDSFVADRDIIDSGKDGIIVPKIHNDFSAEKMANAVELVIADCEGDHKMALAAIEKSKKYSLDIIYKRWIELFRQLGMN